MAYTRVDQVNDTEFIIRHRDEQERDVKITMEVDLKRKQVHFNNLANTADFMLSKLEYEMKLNNPLTCLKLILTQG